MANHPNGHAQKHRIVCLEACHVSLPTFGFDHDYVEHDNTAPSQVLERIRDATIVIATLCPVTREVAAQCRRLQLVAIYATGSGWVDRDYFKSRGITVINCPRTNIAACSEHTLGLYFAVRKRIVEMHQRTIHTDEWQEKGTLTKRFVNGPPRTCADEEVAIFGHGALGQGIERIFRAVGVGKILVADRKGVEPEHSRPGRVAFKQAVENATVLILSCPKDASTIDLVGEEELRLMRKDAIVINMARGGIANEAALTQALREGQIAGAATDVLEEEPPNRADCPLLAGAGQDEVPNLTISPHVSWYSITTLDNLRKVLKAGLEGFVDGNTINAIV